MYETTSDEMYLQIEVGQSNERTSKLTHRNTMPPYYCFQAIKIPRSIIITNMNIVSHVCLKTFKIHCKMIQIKEK